MLSLIFEHKHFLITINKQNKLSNILFNMQKEKQQYQKGRIHV